jgi:uncharacterized protein (TIGR03067 family)
MKHLSRISFYAASFVLLIALVACSTPAPTLTPLEKDTAALQGTWKPVSRKDGASVRNVSSSIAVRFTFSGDRVIASDGKREEQGTFVLAAEKTPREIDLRTSTGKKTLSGIYRLEGDVLTICVNTNGKGRPADFQPQEGSAGQLVVFERVK